MTILYNLAILFWGLGLIFVVGAQESTSIISKEFQPYLPSHISKTNFTLDDAKKLLYKKCKKAIVPATGSLSAETQYTKIEKAGATLKDCASIIPNTTVLLSEMEEARPKGDLDEFFQKYCDKGLQVRQCINEFNHQWLECLTPAERHQNSVTVHIVSTLLDYACENNGAAMALFIAEQGPECMETHKENISNCMNATLSTYKLAMPPTELPELVIRPRQCLDLHDLEKCVVSYVEECNEGTVANIIEAIFRYVRKETKCQEEIDKVIGVHGLNGQQRNAATGTGLFYCVTSLVVMMMVNLVY